MVTLLFHHFDHCRSCSIQRSGVLALSAAVSEALVLAHDSWWIYLVFFGCFVVVLGKLRHFHVFCTLTLARVGARVVVTQVSNTLLGSLSASSCSS